MTKVTVGNPLTFSQLKPNPDAELASTLLSTILSEDLFQLVKKAQSLSRFVREVFCQYPQLAAEALIAQQVSSSCDRARLGRSFVQFCYLKEVLSESQMMQKLRLFRRAHAAAIAVLELNRQISIETSCEKISNLADILIQAAYEWCIAVNQQKFGIPVYRDTSPQQKSQNMVIVAMGKLGGFELNFSSDIDLIFFYPESGETSGVNKPIENHKFFQRLSTQLIKLLDEVTADGFVYRVDMRLRPYGDAGALVCSFAQAEDYYQEQGRDWERFAMLRARCLSGSEVEQAQLDDIIRPFSFRRYIDYGVIDSIRGMKEMIQREVRRKGLQGNIKLGAGGIREIEFIVQSLQLIQGGRDQRLRQRNTLKVLPLLVEAKLLEQSVATSLADSYRLLRRVEHCLQELAEKQTQLLPVEQSEQDALCIAMDYPNWASLQAQIETDQNRVNRHFNELFGESRHHSLSQDEFYHSLAEGHIDAEQIQMLMQAKRGPDKPHLTVETYQQFINHLTQFGQGSAVLKLTARGAKRLKTFFPAMLAACLQSENPDVSLERALTVLQSIIKRTAYLELLSENPPILQHFIDLIGRSPWVVKRLSDYPVLFDELLYPSSLYEPLQTTDLRAELQQNLLRIDPDDEEALMDTLRTFKQTNELRVAAALLAEKLSISQVSRYLTQLAEVILQSTLKQCWRGLVQTYGLPQALADQSQSFGFAIVGYGKLGGFELGFGSDLDLVFLYNQTPTEQTNGQRQIGAGRFYTRLAQKIIHFVSTRTNLGLLYEVDMRLRPSGSSGLLVSHINAFAEYQLESAWTWEHQALVRSRFIAGDNEIQDHFIQIRRQAIFQPRDLNKLADDIKQMRHKMRQQLELKQAQKIDLKQSAGGLVDIEFLSQYFCLACYSTSLSKATADFDLSIPSNTVEGLKLAIELNMLDETDARVLINCYRLFRNRLNEMSLQEESSLNPHTLFSDLVTQVKMIWQKVLGDNSAARLI